MSSCLHFILLLNSIVILSGESFLKSILMQILKSPFMFVYLEITPRKFLILNLENSRVTLRVKFVNFF